MMMSDTTIFICSNKVDDLPVFPTVIYENRSQIKFCF